MCKNAFGGHHRLDKCNLQGPSLIGDVLVDVASNVPSERTLWVNVIEDACNHYKFFGLGNNGAEDVEFWYAVEFLFRVRASKPETWQDATRRIHESYKDAAGKRRVHEHTLTDDELRAMCFDWAWAHLQFGMSLRLKAERAAVVKESWRQIADYLRLPGALDDWESALVCPTKPEQVEALLKYRYAAPVELWEAA